MAGAGVRTGVAMGTFVSFEVAGEGTEPAGDVETALDRAFQWFEAIEAVCTRFDPASELMQLTARAGRAVPASAVLFEAVRFALAVAEASGGAFDPTVGGAMEARGFNREHRTRQVVQTGLSADGEVSYRDVVLDADARTIQLRRPLVLDLGAVAKGLAVDMAAQVLRPFKNFAIDAGGDLYFGGVNPRGEKWSVGVRHPRRHEDVIDVLAVSGAAVCTSGDYERPHPSGAGHHLLDPRTGDSATGAASVTVIAPTTMAADALATAAFVLGPVDGLAFLERQGVEGLVVTSRLERLATSGLASYRAPHDQHARTTV